MPANEATMQMVSPLATPTPGHRTLPDDQEEMAREHARYRFLFLRGSTAVAAAAWVAAGRLLDEAERLWPPAVLRRIDDRSAHLFGNLLREEPA